jgi:uncharacterized protein
MVSMILFLVIFTSLYSGLHLYALTKINRAFALGTGAMIIVIVFMATMVAAPILIRQSERMGLEKTAVILSYIGYLWMGFLFLFISAALCMDIYRLLLHFVSFIMKKNLSAFSMTSRAHFFFILLIAAVITFYGWFEALGIKTEHISLKTSKIPEAIGRLKIVQISDVHLGLIVRGQRLAGILKAVKAARPDILVSTGDLVDAQMDNQSRLAEMLREIQPRYGKYAVFGNHEYYAGLERSRFFTEEAGFSILFNQVADVSGLIHIAGVDDRAGSSNTLSGEVTERRILDGLPREKFTLFLKHRPLLDKDAAGLFDLQLSGHAHKGQIFPFSLVTRFLYPTDSGLLPLRDKAYLYVSRGTGTWGPPIRFLAPPEVTVIELVYGDQGRP